jgi:hypothetical protein
LTSIGKSEAERIDQFVAAGLRLIGLPTDAVASLSKLPSQFPGASNPTENVPTFNATIGNTSR